MNYRTSQATLENISNIIEKRSVFVSLACGVACDYEFMCEAQEVIKGYDKTLKIMMEELINEFNR